MAAPTATQPRTAGDGNEAQGDELITTRRSVRRQADRMATSRRLLPFGLFGAVVSGGECDEGTQGRAVAEASPGHQSDKEVHLCSIWRHIPTWVVSENGKNRTLSCIQRPLRHELTCADLGAAAQGVETRSS